MLDPDILVPLKLYVGVYAAHLGDSLRAVTHFRAVADRFPNHPLTPLALAAAGAVFMRQMDDTSSAQQMFQQLISRFPKSPEALYARQLLER